MSFPSSRIQNWYYFLRFLSSNGPRTIIFYFFVIWFWKMIWIFYGQQNLSLGWWTLFRSLDNRYIYLLYMTIYVLCKRKLVFTEIIILYIFSYSIFILDHTKTYSVLNPLKAFWGFIAYEKQNWLWKSKLYYFPEFR